jgi:virginiamycin B lyase
LNAEMNTNRAPIEARLARADGTEGVLVMHPARTGSRLLLSLLFAFAAAARAAKIVEFPLPNANSQPYTIVLGPDGQLWFTEVAGNRIGTMTTAGVFVEFPIPTANSGAVGITFGPGESSVLYFTKSNLGTVGEMFLDGVFGPDLTGFSGPSQIVVGPEGRFWVTETSASKIYAKKFYSYSPASVEMPTLTASASPIGISIFDGAILFTEDGANKIGVADPITSTVLGEVSIPTASSHPRRITGGFDSNVWFTENAANQIGRWNFSLESPPQEFPIPTPASAPLGITRGPDGNIWFTEHAGNKIGRITPNGVITEYTIPTAGSGPTSICAGPDGNLYFTENTANKIGKLRLFIPGDVNDDGTVDVADVFYTINFLFAGGPAPK